MGLTGYNPADPIPEHVREFKPGQGDSASIPSTRDFLVMGNRLAAGTETLDSVSDAAAEDDSDLSTRVGAGSELWWMVRALRLAHPTATIYLGPVTEASGTSASVDLVVSGTSDATSSVEFSWGGFKLVVPLDDAATPLATATKIKAAFDDWEGGTMPFTMATPALDVADYDCAVTARHDGPRGSQIIEEDSATKGLRVRALGPANTQTVTKDVASAVNGATEDDFTSALAAAQAMAEKGKVYHLITPKSDASPSATDNGMGELSKLVKDIALPASGIDVQFHAATRLANSAGVTQSTAAAMNNWQGNFWWMENSDWTTGMIAAYMAGLVGAQQAAHPCANINGLATDIPQPFLAADNPTRAEKVNALNNGLSVLAFSGNAVRIVRHITNQSLGATGNNDYRVREGHIPSAYHFAWGYLYGRMLAQQQPFADDDPPDGTIPPARTWTPSLVKGIHDTAIRELTDGKPLGIYDGAILRPSEADGMIAKSSVVFAGGGAFSLVLNWQVNQHLIKTMTQINGVDEAY
jgi:phage tail sheath gpL-like